MDTIEEANPHTVSEFWDDIAAEWLTQPDCEWLKQAEEHTWLQYALSDFAAMHIDQVADQRTRDLNEKLEAAEKDRMLELAIAQFTGWREAESCMDIIKLITSMGLTRKEWREVKPQIQWLPKKYRDEIDEHFKLSGETK